MPNLVFKFIALIVYELGSSSHTPNGFGNGFSIWLHWYTNNLPCKVSFNNLIVLDFGCSPKLMDEFRHHHHLGVLEEVVDVAQHKVCVHDVSNIFQIVNILKVFDMNFGFFVLQIDFYSKNGHSCRSDDLYNSTFLR